MTYNTDNAHDALLEIATKDTAQQDVPPPHLQLLLYAFSISSITFAVMLGLAVHEDEPAETTLGYGLAFASCFCISLYLNIKMFYQATKSTSTQHNSLLSQNYTAQICEFAKIESDMADFLNSAALETSKISASHNQGLKLPLVSTSNQYVSSQEVLATICSLINERDERTSRITQYGITEDDVNDLQRILDLIKPLSCTLSTEYEGAVTRQQAVGGSNVI